MIYVLKDHGGLTVEVLEIKNKCIISKWLFKLLNEKGVWEELLHNKYPSQKSLPKLQVNQRTHPFERNS
jgi:hypothetical protein